MRRLESEKFGNQENMPTFPPGHRPYGPKADLLSFLLSYFSKYLCLFVFIRGFPYPLSYFWLKDFGH
jgi:hypothetical protein